MKEAVFLGFILLFGLQSGTVLAKGPQPPEEISTAKGLVDAVVDEFRRHDYKKVIQLYQDFVKAHPDHFLPTVVRVFYSQSLADTGEIDAAIMSLKDLLTGLPPQFDTLKLQYDLANLLFLQRRYDEARSAFQKILLQTSEVNEVLSKAKERLALMKDKDSRKKDFVSLQLLDIETNLDAGIVPDGAEAFLKKIAVQSSPGAQADQAVRLQRRVKEVRTEKAKALLDEARRLYDQEKKYGNVRDILVQIKEDYSDVSEMPSVEVLLKEVNSRLGKEPGR